MITGLVVISLLLHGVTMLWILTLMQKQSARDASEELEAYKKEIEDVLMAYITEIKEENERLVKELEERANRKGSQVDEHSMEALDAATPTIVRTEKEPKPLSSKRVQASKSLQSSKTTVNEPQDDAYGDYKPPFVDESGEDVLYEQSETSRVLALAKQGYDVEAIAKKLKMGKGEVELLLKFYG
ncbi:DUF6115 domain-containing protein [Halalkalibacterium ligniniphilum]|uniref:DUF6115 domain-containing protein n=1 Tax=Halalkalibacterium ligniniphilum TaxID=1134413 RepID=UPI00034B33F7|nr:hypothetical protein [Halalkalibacterium ligniniphilum]